MKTAEILYNGNLRTTSKHLRSGIEIISDAPVDNNGKGEAFSPTDLLATSLASCMITIIGIKSEHFGINVVDMKALVQKEMTSSPRRVKSVEIDLTVFGNFTEDEKSSIYDYAINCPVAKSLNSEIDQRLNLEFKLV
jgi:putative redox protein